MLKAISKTNHYLRKYKDGLSNLKVKSTFQIYLDLLKWVIRNHGKIQTFFILGLHNQGKNVDDYLTYRSFKKLYKDFYPQSYLAILEDKLVFEKFINNYPKNAPVNLGYMSRINLCIYPGQPEPFENIVNYNIECIVKDSEGWGGSKIFKLKVENESIFINGQLSSLEVLKNKLTGRSVMQKLLQQHEAINTIYADSINTLRLVTVNTGTHIHFISVFMRMGLGGSFVDNVGQGNMAIPVDKDTGKLTGYAITDSDPYILRKHPDTGTLFENFQIPYFQQSVDLCLKLHSDLPYFFLLGWDVATTPDGPVIIECNNLHHIVYSQLILGGLKKDFEGYIREFLDNKKKLKPS